MTDRDFLKTLVLFLIYDVAEDTKESAVELYRRWSKKYNIKVKGPKRAAWTLEFLESQKNYRREAVIAAARIDGFISR